MNFYMLPPKYPHYISSAETVAGVTFVITITLL